MLEKNKVYIHKKHGLIEYKGMKLVNRDFKYSFDDLKYNGHSVNGKKAEIIIDDIEEIEEFKPSLVF